MKRKYISLIMALVLAFVNAPMKISAAQTVTEVHSYDNTAGTSEYSKTITINEGDFLLIEYTYTPKTSTSSGWGGICNSGAASIWRPVIFSSGKIKADYYYGSGNSTVEIGTYTAGTTYHILSVIEIKNGHTKASIYLNGQMIFNAKDIYMNMVNAAMNRLHISAGVNASINKVDGISSVSDFDASAYSALVTSTDADIEITGEGYNTKWFTNFAIDASKKRNLTASELLSYLEIPQGATTCILYEGEEIGENDILETDMELIVTSSNGKVTQSYAITAGATLIKSSTYKINNQENEISGIKRYTPTEDFLGAFTIKEATSIEGVSPQGDFIEDGMQLEVLDAEGNSVYFDLVLSEKYTEVVPDDELYLIKNLDGKIKGKNTLIEGSVEIPTEGLTSDIEIYFRMYDATKAYVMQLTKEGQLSFWKNAAGSVQNGKTYDFSVVTDSLGGSFDAYVNGVRVLSGASLNGEMDATTDPYELILNYDAEILLTEVYSSAGYSDYYEESSALIDSNNENTGVSIKGAEDLSVNMFVSQDYTVGELKSDLILPEDATLKFYDEADGEITDDTALVSQASYLSVTSKNSKYTANYLLSIATEVLRSDSFNVDNNEKTVSGILSYTPVSVILAALEVRPDYTLSGIFRGEEKLTSGVISNDDKIRLIKNDAVVEYDIVITPDIAPEGTVYTIPDGTLGSVTILECEVTLPLEGEIPTMNYYLYNPETAKEAWFFGVGATGYLSIWGARRIENMERGRTYTVAVLNNHKAAKADIYIDGIKVASGVSTTTWMLTTTEFTQMRLSGSSKTVTNTRFYKAYDAESFKYINDITLKSTGNGVTANPNLITVNDTSCNSVGDLLSTLTFPSGRAEETITVFGNGAQITDETTELCNDMYLTFEAEGGITGKYLIDIPSKPITSYVFTVGEDDISYNANLTYYDFIRHSILSRGTELKILRADGSEVTDGNIDSTMKAKAGEKEYTITLTGTSSALPKVEITDAVEDEIIQTTDNFTKTVKLEGTDITKATVYFDGAAIPFTASAGEYTFAKTNLTVGRHEFYAEVYSENGKSMTKTYAVYVFDKDVDRLPVADQPVVMDIYYLDADGNTLTAGESVSSEKLKAIKLFFNKELLESSITKENIVLSKDGNVVTGYGVSYTQNDTDYIVTMSLDENLDYSSQYQITVMAPLTAADENTAQADSVITFKTSPKPFDIINKILLDENGDEATSLAGGDSAKVSLSLTNTSVENKDGIAVLVIYEGSRMVGYSLTDFNISAGMVNQTIPTNTAQIASAATGTLTYKVYLWEGVNDRTSMLK